METNKRLILQVTIFLVGMCSIIYELLISTVSSYFLGDSIKSFSLVIGFYMASMGLGSYLSKYFTRNLILSFINIEIILGAVGALSVPILYGYFSYSDFDGFRFLVLLLVCIIGALTGLEIPLVTRILENDYQLKENLSQVLSLDYAGALIATLVFPFFFVPVVGNLKTALIFGLININVGLANYWFFRKQIDKKPATVIRLAAIILIGFLALFFYFSNDYVKHWNQNIFKYPVVYESQSPYQKITLTKNGDEVRLYLNNAIQFSSRDEHRYHEAITHIPLNNIEAETIEVLVLGGGEGLVARELLMHREVMSVDVVDIDPAITELALKNPLLLDINRRALLDERVQVINDDAFNFLGQSTKVYDLIIADLPDPNTEVIARLYSAAFFRLVKKNLAAGGTFATQATSPELTPKAFWCISKTLKEAGFKYSLPYNANVPSFGNWGFFLASDLPLKKTYQEKVDTKSLTNEIYRRMQVFPKEYDYSDIETNQLDQPVILQYYLDHWESLNYEKR